MLWDDRVSWATGCEIVAFASLGATARLLNLPLTPANCETSRSTTTMRQPDVQTRRMLLADWFATLARESGFDFKQQGKSGEAFTLGGPNAFHVTAHFIEASPFLNFVAS